MLLSNNNAVIGRKAVFLLSYVHDLFKNPGRACVDFSVNEYRTFHAADVDTNATYTKCKRINSI